MGYSDRIPSHWCSLPVLASLDEIERTSKFRPGDHAHEAPIVIDDRKGYDIVSMDPKKRVHCCRIVGHWCNISRHDVFDLKGLTLDGSHVRDVIEGDNADELAVPEH